jgi:N-acetylated-alpha-linked acidic dipeptidase
MYVPGYYTGYGVKTLPGIREALGQRNWQEASEQVGLVASTIEGFAREVDRATAVLRTR